MIAPFVVGDSIEYGVEAWRQPIARSLKQAGLYPVDRGFIIDLGGGKGPLFNYVNHARYQYVVVDKVIREEASCLRIAADVCCLPIADRSVTACVSITSLQYYNNTRFFSECRRVLKHGGIIALHENGPHNPFILVSRLAQRMIGLISRQSWQYRNTIRRYYRPADVPDGFEVVYQDVEGFLTPIVHMLSVLRVPGGKRLVPALSWMDSKLFGLCPPLKRLAFLNIVHLRKKSG